MKDNVFEVLLGHHEHIAWFCKKHIPTLFVLGKVLIFTLFEIGQLFCIITLNPAGFVQADGFPTTLSTIFVQQALLYYFKLKLSDSANNFATIELVRK